VGSVLQGVGRDRGGGVGHGAAAAARLFSGSRGIHVAWDVDPEAFQLGEDGQIDLAGYVLAVLAIEPKADRLESMRQYVHKPRFASKLFLAALVLHAMHTQMEGGILDDAGRRALGADRDTLACTLARKDSQYPNKITVDCQPLVHRWLSPHHKTGRVTRSIVDEAGAIRQGFRVLSRVQVESELWHAAGDLPKRPERYAAQPGFVTRAAVEALVGPRELGATIAMLLAEGDVPCCTMVAQRYEDLHDYYAEFLERKKMEAG